MGFITAEPNPFRPDSQGLGQTTLTWLAHGTSEVEVRVDAPDGPLLAREGPGRLFSTDRSMGPRRHHILFTKCFKGLAIGCGEHDCHSHTQATEITRGMRKSLGFDFMNGKFAQG